VDSMSCVWALIMNLADQYRSRIVGVSYARRSRQNGLP
jgi:hypothetical protein